MASKNSRSARIEVGAEPFVDLLDDPRQRFLVRLVALAAAVEHGDDLADGVAQGDGSFELLLDAQVGQLDQRSGVDGDVVAADLGEGGERLAVQVVPVQLGVGERHHLRQEPVGAHEPLQGVDEPLLLVLVEVGEPVDRRGQRGVDPTVVDAVADQQQGDDGLDLVGPQHAVLVEGVAGVVEQVRVGRWGDGRAVVGLEGGADLLGVVAEVEDERAVLVRVDPVEPGQGLHGVQARQRLVDVHGVELRLVEAGLVLLGDDEDLVLVGVEHVGHLGLGDAVELGLGDLVAVDVELAGEGDEHADVGVAVVVDVLGQRPVVAHGVLA